MVLARVTKLPYIGTPHKRSLETKEVKIVAVPMPEPKPDIVPLWIIILSAIVGVIILLLLIYLLYKVEYTFEIKIFSKNYKITKCGFLVHYLVRFLQASPARTFTRATAIKSKQRLPWRRTTLIQ